MCVHVLVLSLSLSLSLSISLSIYLSIYLSFSSPENENCPKGIIWKDYIFAQDGFFIYLFHTLHPK